jgi:hypothetical protein
MTPGMTKLALYWSTIQAGVEGRLSTADLWSAIQSAAIADTGNPIRGASSADLSRLRGLAAANRQAAQNFESAATTYGLTPDMIGASLRSSGVANADTPRDWLVRFEHTVIDNGVESTIWRSSLFRGTLPPTKQSLLDTIEADGMNLASDYQQTHVGIGGLRIMAA